MTMTSVLLATSREPQHHGTLQIIQCSVFLQEMTLVIYLHSLIVIKFLKGKCKNQNHIYLVIKLFEVKFSIQLTIRPKLKYCLFPQTQSSQPGVDK